MKTTEAGLVWREGDCWDGGRRKLPSWFQVADEYFDSWEGEEDEFVIAHAQDDE